MKGYRDKDSTKDPFMSPIFAPDELLSGLPPIHIIVSIIGIDTMFVHGPPDQE